ncbi:MAG: TetR/AcrR family transcriptional regulator [Mogibacterium sp.]|nr:TetR/AcrR family transcriptional regulator [Mogibacterium sp.]
MSEDFRYKRTEKHIREAFLHLLRTKKYEKITVNDIAEHAEISRNAFYSHYYSKEELLYSLMDVMINKCNENQDRILDEKGYFDAEVARSMLVSCIEPLYEDEELCKLFFRVGGGEVFSQRLAKALADFQFSKSNKTSLTSRQRRDLRLYCDYRASGVVGVIRSSFLSDEPYAKDDLVELLYTIGTGGGNQMLDPVEHNK